MNLYSEISLNSLGVNSISFIQLVVAIEDEFDIEFNDECLNSEFFGTISDIVNYIECKIKEKGQI